MLVWSAVPFLHITCQFWNFLHIDPDNVSSMFLRYFGTLHQTTRCRDLESLSECEIFSGSTLYLWKSLLSHVPSVWQGPKTHSEAASKVQKSVWKLCYDRQSLGQSVLVSHHILDPRLGVCCCQIMMGLFMTRQLLLVLASTSFSGPIPKRFVCLLQLAQLRLRFSNPPPHEGKVF